jgi:hypothetical protein
MNMLLPLALPPPPTARDDEPAAPLPSGFGGGRFGAGLPVAVGWDLDFFGASDSSSTSVGSDMDGDFSSYWLRAKSFGNGQISIRFSALRGSRVNVLTQIRIFEFVAIHFKLIVVVHLALLGWPCRLGLGIDRVLGRTDMTPRSARRIT